MTDLQEEKRTEHIHCLDYHKKNKGWLNASTIDIKKVKR